MLSDKPYEIYFTGTTPQNLRYHWLNNEDSAVLVGVWYAQAWRLDVSVNGFYKIPTNGHYNSDGQMWLYNRPGW